MINETSMTTIARREHIDVPAFGFHQTNNVDKLYILREMVLRYGKSLLPEERMI
jgi:hypothetical protein